MMDPVSLAITRRYPDLRVPEAQACLHALAALTWNDISQVEATHASTRRITTVKSTQTTTVSFEHINSLYFAKQISAARELAQQQAGLKSHETRNQKKTDRTKPSTNAALRKSLGLSSAVVVHTGPSSALTDVEACGVEHLQLSRILRGGTTLSKRTPRLLSTM